MQVVESPERGLAVGATFTAKEREGYVKEYIEQEGLAMLLNKELGLVLFHLDSVWIDGSPSKDRRRAKGFLSPGTEVTFLVRSFHGEEYKDFSEEKVVKQAVAVWLGIRPNLVLKVAMGEENTRQLEEHRKTFMLYIRGEVFMRVSLVRILAEVAGYLTNNLGILGLQGGQGHGQNPLPHG